MTYIYLFSDLCLAKFLNILIKSFFPHIAKKENQAMLSK